MPQNNAELTKEFWKYASAQVGASTIERTFEKWANAKKLPIDALTEVWHTVKADIAEILTKQAAITVTFDGDSAARDYEEIMGKKPGAPGATEPIKVEPIEQLKPKGPSSLIGAPGAKPVGAPPSPLGIGNDGAAPAAGAADSGTAPQTSILDELDSTPPTAQ